MSVGQSSWVLGLLGCQPGMGHVPGWEFREATVYILHRAGLLEILV